MELSKVALIGGGAMLVFATVNQILPATWVTKTGRKYNVFKVKDREYYIWGTTVAVITAAGILKLLKK